MAMTPEARVKKSVREFLDAFSVDPVWYFNPFMAGYGRTGVPDFVGCIDGKFFAIECKAGTNQPTALQQRELDAIARAKGFVWVARENNINEMKARFTQWLVEA